MRIRWYALATAALLCVGMAALLLLVPPAQAPKNDTVLINDLRYRLEQDFERVRAEGTAALPALDTPLAYSVFDTDGRLLAATDDGLAQDLNEAIRDRGTIVDLTVDSRAVGKLVIDNNATTSLNDYRLRTQVILAIILVLLALVFALLLWRVHRGILRPFHRLERFASNVAAGNLDIPLNMDHKNSFGAFTESFDLMRTELAAAREGQRRATQSKKELAAQLSHDIKSPVSSIKAVSELMQVSETDAQSRERAATIEAKADQIDLLVNDMLSATLEELQELAVSPVETPSSTVAELVERADYRRLITAVSVPPCLIIADAIRLEQALDNIIGNSYKYADTPIIFEAEILDGYLWLAFTDAGRGVDPDELPLLTQKFYRGANAAAKSGSGLGLYIAHAFLERMGGALSCENIERNGGSGGFCVRLALRLA